MIDILTSAQNARGVTVKVVRQTGVGGYFSSNPVSLPRWEYSELGLSNSPHRSQVSLAAARVRQP